MSRKASHYVCQQCGAVHAKWGGRCEQCGAWNSLVEESAGDSVPKGLGRQKGQKLTFAGMEGERAQIPRRVTGIEEFDRVTGGGLVPASAVLVGGDPGIGKSTILLQAAAALSERVRCAYISGEEAVDQLRLRADRLGLSKAAVLLAACASIRDIAASLEAANAPEVVVIDSIQTMFVDTLESAPGTVAQVRTSAQELIRIAKRRGISLILVGHVTKEGLIAGPRVLEHMVDTVLYFEGERGHQFRILRAVKNRFGPTDEIGVFEMTDAGLIEVRNPSALFLANRGEPVSGASVFAGVEGSRPVLVEIQALIAPSVMATPRRAVVGWDTGRLAMIMAVLEARCGLALSGHEVYLNVAGGLKISEPGADLAVAAALISSLQHVPVAQDTVFFGEVGLSGEVRPVSRADARLKESAKLGFTRAIIPRGRTSRTGKGPAEGNMSLIEIGHVSELFDVFGQPLPKVQREAKSAQDAPLAPRSR